MLFALAIPVANRVQKSMNALIASPEANTKPPNARLAQPTMGTRFTRSASQPIGTAPSTKNADDAVAMNTIVPELIPKVLRISGASTLMAAPSSSSNESRRSRTTNMSLPPTLNALWNDTGSEFDARQQVVGEDDLLAANASARSRRVLLVEHGRGEGRRRRVALLHVVHLVPPDPDLNPDALRVAGAYRFRTKRDSRSG